MRILYFDDFGVNFFLRCILWFKLLIYSVVGVVAAMGVKKILKIFCEKVCRIKKSVYLCTRLQEISTTNDGAIAQLVEQRTENPCVPGSNPGGTTVKKSKTT